MKENTKYAPECPAWCTDKLGCQEWNQYDDHQNRIHEKHLRGVELRPITPDGAGELNLSVDIVAEESFSVDWDARSLAHKLMPPTVIVHVSERLPGRHWLNADIRVTADEALELSDYFRQAAEELQRIERGAGQ